MQKLTFEQVNNMSEDTMRRLLLDEVLDQNFKEQAEEERRKAEEEARAKEEERLNGFFADRFKNKSPRFGDQY